MKENWIVIRFTEKQILQQLDECCKFIQSVKNKIIQPGLAPY